MRSGLIFRASDHISNRYLLCRVISTSARKMHRSGLSTSHSINQSLVALDGAGQHSVAVAKPDAPIASGEQATEPQPDGRELDVAPEVR